jgi:hypothetical protein
MSRTAPSPAGLTPPSPADALEEFGDDSAVVTSAASAKERDRLPHSVKLGVNMGGGKPAATSDDTMREALHSVKSELQRPEFSSAFSSVMGGLQPAGGSEEGESATLFRALAVESGADGAAGIAKTMEILQKLSLEADNLGAGAVPGPGISSDSTAAAEGMSDEMINRMMAEFEGMGKKEDFASVVDGMMRQLLSKDIMHVPMKAIRDRFPEWLATHGAKLSPEAYASYGRMYQTFQKMVDTYETAPDNFPRLLELMQDMQECGNPPPEIIAQLAPGLQMGGDGMPAMMPNMGPDMPEMPGMPGGCSVQ